MNFILRYIRPHFKYLGFTFVIKTAATLIELIIPYILSHIVDVIVPKENVGEIVFWGFMMILCAAAAYLCNVIANRRSVKTARDTTEKIRHDLFHASLHLSCKNADRLTIPSLESRLTSDTYNLHHFIGMMQRIGVRAPLLLFGGVAITLVLDPYLALVMIAMLPFLALFVIFISIIIPLCKKRINFASLIYLYDYTPRNLFCQRFRGVFFIFYKNFKRFFLPVEYRL